MKKTLLFAAAMAVSANLFAVDYYVIGSNVNGKSWALAQEDAKFEAKGNGIYEWKGEVLGTGFKINDGTWSSDQYNLGSNGDAVEEGTPYVLGVGGASGNIAIFDCAEVNNPVLTFDENEMSIVLTGDFGGEMKWYVAGLNGEWLDAGLDWHELAPTADEDIYECKDVEITVEEGVLKVCQTGYAKEYGTTNSEEVYFDAEHMKQTLEVVGGEAGDVPYVLTPGKYTFTFNFDEETLEITGAGSGVDGIELEEGEVAYFTLDGVRIANPIKGGIYVKLVGTKANKVIVK